MRSQNCSSGDPCSSSCRCFDGKNERMDNTEEFSVDGIEGQGEMIVRDINYTFKTVQDYNSLNIAWFCS